MHPSLHFSLKSAGKNSQLQEAKEKVGLPFGTSREHCLNQAVQNLRAHLVELSNMSLLQTSLLALQMQKETLKNIDKFLLEQRSQIDKTKQAAETQPENIIPTES